MLPEGWASAKFGDAFKSSRTKGRPGLPTLSVTLFDGLVSRDSIDRKMDTNLSVEEHLLVRQGEIAYNMMRMWQGASGLAPYDAVVSPAYIVLCPKAGSDSHFASYLFKYSRSIYNFWAYSYGITEDRLRLYFKDFAAIPVNLPPLPEQKRIAEILSTWDAAIGVQERLIVNARTQKKALMQSLLTGKKRLPGFEGAWKIGRFRDLLDLYIGGTPSRRNDSLWDQANQTTNHWFAISDLAGKYIEIAKERISDEGVKRSNVKLLPAGTVVMSFKLSIGRKAILRQPGYTNEAICALIPKATSHVERLFVYHILEVIDLEESVDQAIKGKTLNKAKIAELKLPYPELAEQAAIVTILEAEDTHIEFEQNKLEILRQEKSALMHQLLTGKRRVKIEDSKT
jgi:type I restriction enzyme, S subunit